MTKYLIKENQRKILGIKIIKTHWLYSNIEIINKSYFLFIINIINKYIIIIVIYYNLRKEYNKYKYI